ncbi:MAG: restriction endonuclease [Acidobacteria bacterium]|nr:restriction endonuclease [Acidobacteriota bacterium]MBI3422683.1 restriction endonuclease [Acidobacteriota bacterium]
MPIPDFQTLMLPLLRHLSDGVERINQETIDALANEFNLTDAERTQLLPSGQQTVFRNRVAWAKAHFKRAGLIESPRRGIYRITDRGREVLTQNPKRVDLKFLDKFPGHREFRFSSKLENEPETVPQVNGLTPEEHIALGYQQIREELAADLIRRVKECAPEFFEQLVIDLLLAMGYGGSRQDAGKAVGRSGDGGIDGIIKEDRLGLDAIYIQAKRWEGVVGRPEIQKFAGALQGQRARKGIFITTSSFTKEAREFVSAIDSKIILVGGDMLASLMIDHGIGVTEIAAYVVKRIDSDYFGQE